MNKYDIIYCIYLCISNCDLAWISKRHADVLAPQAMSITWVVVYLFYAPRTV